MSPQAGKAAFSLALFVTIPSLVLIMLEPRGSAEFVVTSLTLATGVLFLILVTVVVRRTMR